MLTVLSVGLLLQGAQSEKKTYQWAADETLQTACSGACAAILPDGSALITGGHGASGVLTSVELLGAPVL